MNLACVDLRMTINEALAAATINSAFSLGVEKSRGSIELEKNTDILILKTSRYKLKLSTYFGNFEFSSRSNRIEPELNTNSNPISNSY